MEKVFTFYDLDGAAALGASARPVRRRPGRRQRRRHADQVPGRAARVLLPGRLVLPRARHPRPGRAHLRHPARRRVHQADGVERRSAGCSTSAASSWSPSSTPARSTARAAGSSATTSARSPSTSPSSSRCTAARPTSADSPGLGDALDFVLTDPHTLQSEVAPEHLRHRRRRQPARLEGRLGHPLRGRGPGREHQAVPGRRAARRVLRRARQLLHRDRLPQGDAHRLQLRHRAGRRALPDRGRRAAAQGVPAQPPRQADVPVVLLARPAPRPRHPRASRPTCRPPAST